MKNPDLRTFDFSNLRSITGGLGRKQTSYGELVVDCTSIRSSFRARVSCVFAPLSINLMTAFMEKLY